MNWLDWVLLAMIAGAVFKGYSRGFIIEVCSLLALVAGIWAGIHMSDRVVEAIGLSPKSAAMAFLITFVLVLVAIHLIGRGLTTLVDIAQLSFPNKVAGSGFAMVRQAFVLSVLLNLLAGYTDDRQPSEQVREGSVTYMPMRAIAPFMVPALGRTKWVKRAVDKVKEGIQEIGSEGL